MKLHINLFVKICFLLLSMITITLFFYGLSYKRDVEVITNQINSTDGKQLDFFTKQMDNQINQLAINAYTLLQDPTIRHYTFSRELGHLVHSNQTISTVLEKLALQTSASNWDNRIVIHNMNKREVLSSDDFGTYQDSLVSEPLPQGWNYHSIEDGMEEGKFRLLYGHPKEFADMPEHLNLIVEVSFPLSNIRKMAEEWNQDGSTFLYHPQWGPLVWSEPLDGLSTHVVKSINSFNGEGPNSTVFEHSGHRFLVSMVRSSSLGWYVVHYTPLNNVMQPIQKSRLSFLTASLVLCLLGIWFALMLFRQVQRPISLLLQALNSVKEGRWVTRISTNKNDEFTVLNQGFNEMAEQIQTLIEQVYMEQLRTKDAYLKQLQAQINPHFLYNCLFFIKSKAKVGDTDSVEAMSLNLGEYYRYMTRMEHSMTTLSEELKLLRNYLTIQNLRKERIEYTIEIEEELLQEPLPKLLIQPLVENSIIHGIEQKTGRGTIHIRGVVTKDGWELSVEDNGVGMTHEQIEKLQDRLGTTDPAVGGCGLWNVQQRLQHYYGEQSCLLLASSNSGGTTITLRIQRGETDHAANSAG